MFRVHSIDLDHRLAAFCVNVSTSYDWYLRTTRGAENNLDIQRKIIKGSKSYGTLRQDLKLGCVLPPIVVACNVVNLPIRLNDTAHSVISAEEGGILAALQHDLEAVQPSDVYIIDGLQRTNAIRQVADELVEPEKAIFLGRSVRLEMWLNIKFSAIAYRMLLLNAGQRPMSIKHQVEILSQNLKTELQTIPNIQIIDAGRRRVQSGQFQLSKLSLAFQAWLQGNPNVDVRNVVVEQMLADSAIETLGSAISTSLPAHSTETFKGLVEWLIEMDRQVGSPALEFFGNETVLQGIAAAVGSAQRNEHMKVRVENCLRLLKTPQIFADDVLGISTFEEVRKGIDPSKKNVGEATRNLVYTAFQEFFVSDGLKKMSECWNFAGSRP
jgi:hypothetical protein